MKIQRKSTYVLSEVWPAVHLDGKKGHYIKDANGDVACREMVVGTFSSVAKAEEVISKLVKANSEQNEKQGGWEVPFCYFLDEHYLDDSLYGDCNVARFESRRSYLSDGTLNYFSDCDSRCEKKFDGTPVLSKHVKKGDIALCSNGDRITPILIGELPYTKEEWHKHFKPGVYGDYTDDSGIAFTVDGGHIHPFAPDVFPLTCLPYVKMPKSIITKLNKAKDKYHSEQ